MKLCCRTAIILAMASATSVAMAQPTQDGARQIAAAQIIYLEGVRADQVQTRIESAEGQWAVVITESPKNTCKVQLIQNAALNQAGWEVRNYKCTPK